MVVRGYFRGQAPGRRDGGEQWPAVRDGMAAAGAPDCAVVPATFPPADQPRVPLFARGGRTLLHGFLFGLLFWAGLLFAVAILPALAYKTLDNRWDHTNLTFSAGPGIALYARAGMAQWSAASALTVAEGGHDIDVVVAPLLPPIFFAEQTAQANLAQGGGRITHCEVRLDPDTFFALNELARQNVVTHELGHCLGLDHSDQPSVMANPLLYFFSNDDAAAIASLYGPHPQPAPAASPEPAPAPPPSVQTRAEAPPVSIVGWSFATWQGGYAEPATCSCRAVYRATATGWARWVASDPGYLNDISALEPGAGYWMLRD